MSHSIEGVWDPGGSRTGIDRFIILLKHRFLMCMLVQQPSDWAIQAGWYICLNGMIKIFYKQPNESVTHSFVFDGDSLTFTVEGRERRYIRTEISKLPAPLQKIVEAKIRTIDDSPNHGG